MIELQHGALLQLALRVRRLVFGIRVDQERQDTAVDTGGRLDHIRRPSFASFLIEVREINARGFGMHREVVTGAVRDALELAPLRTLKPEAVLDVDRAL